jgi:hypothetical protein
VRRKRDRRADRAVSRSARSTVHPPQADRSGGGVAATVSSSLAVKVLLVHRFHRPDPARHGTAALAHVRDLTLQYSRACLQSRRLNCCCARRSQISHLSARLRRSRINRRALQTDFPNASPNSVIHNNRPRDRGARSVPELCKSRYGSTLRQ